MAEVRRNLAVWRYDHNHRRLHGALRAQTPARFATQNPAPAGEGPPDVAVFLLPNSLALRAGVS